MYIKRRKWVRRLKPKAMWLYHRVKTLTFVKAIWIVLMAKFICRQKMILTLLKVAKLWIWTYLSTPNPTILCRVRNHWTNSKPVLMKRLAAPSQVIKWWHLLVAIYWYAVAKSCLMMALMWRHWAMYRWWQHKITIPIAHLAKTANQV